MTNVLLIANNKYYTEGIWNRSYDIERIDENNVAFPHPTQRTKWEGQSVFIDRFIKIIHILNANLKYITYEKPYDCLLCEQKKVSTKWYIYNNIIWDDGLVHYVTNHNYEPSNKFKDVVYGKSIFNKNKIKLDGTIMSTFIKINKNQMLILDALMLHGGLNKKYNDINDNNNIYRYSEHSGLLDFNGFQLIKIIISGQMSVDENDNEIYFPSNLDEIMEYEYVFHTHPPTPRPGGRASDGVLYEFPSLSDILHFIAHYNEGKIIGSLVITSEGLYNIRKNTQKKSKILINENSLFREYKKIFNKIQRSAISQYGTDFTNEIFFSIIAQDRTSIDAFNEFLKLFDIHIDFYSRKKNTIGDWIIDDVYLQFDK